MSQIHIQLRLHALPDNAILVSPELAVAESNGSYVILNAGGPIFVCGIDDRTARYQAAIKFSSPELRLASAESLARALGLTPSEVSIRRKRLQEDPINGLVFLPSGPKGPRKLTGELLTRVQELLDEGMSVPKVAAIVDLTDHCLYYAINKGTLRAQIKRRSRASDDGPEVVLEEAGTPLPQDISPEPAPSTATVVVDDVALEEMDVKSQIPVEQELAEAPVSKGSEAPPVDEDVFSSAPDRAFRDQQDSLCQMGMAVKREEEREAAREGELVEAQPVFEPARSVAGAGVLLALPAIVGQGYYDVFEKKYQRLRNGFYGLYSVLTTLMFMALLRIKCIEDLSTAKPGEFGRLLGLDRAPEMKTLRRKLLELKQRGQALETAEAFALRWATEEPSQIGVLYVDGHVRAYNGKEKLPKTLVPRRRMCMPATTDYWINGADLNPLLFITAEANEHLLQMLEDEVLPAARRLVKEGQRLLLVFDRDGWSPERFRRWEKEGVDVMTYRKGRYEPWPAEEFTDVRGEIFGREVDYRLAERGVALLPDYFVKEVRRLCDSGHQSSVVTTARRLESGETAVRMFSRWGQENYFRYARREFGLDHLPTYAVEEADGAREVRNPARAEVGKQLEEIRREMRAILQRYGVEALAAAESSREEGAVEMHTVQSLEHANAEDLQRLEALRGEEAALKARRKELPERVPVSQVVGQGEMKQLEEERKRLIDLVNLLAYRSETQMANLVGPLLPGRADEARNFLKRVFKLEGDLYPDQERGYLRVRLHSMSTWRENEALRGMTEYLNDLRVPYPGTELVLNFEPPQTPEHKQDLV